MYFRATEIHLEIYFQSYSNQCVLYCIFTSLQMWQSYFSIEIRYLVNILKYIYLYIFCFHVNFSKSLSNIYIYIYIYAY